MDLSFLYIPTLLATSVIDMALGHVTDECKGFCTDMIGYFCDAFNGICKPCSRHCKGIHKTPDCTKTCDTWKTPLATTMGSTSASPDPTTSTSSTEDMYNWMEHATLGNQNTETSTPNIVNLIESTDETALSPYLLVSLLAMGLLCLLLGYLCWYKGGFKWLLKRLDRRMDDPAKEYELPEIVVDGDESDNEEQDGLLHGNGDDGSISQPDRPQTPIANSEGDGRGEPDEDAVPLSVSESQEANKQGPYNDEVASVSYWNNNNPRDSGFESRPIRKHLSQASSEIGPLLSVEPKRPHIQSAQVIREQPRGAEPFERTPPPTPTQDGTHIGHMIAVGTTDIDLKRSRGHHAAGD